MKKLLLLLATLTLSIGTFAQNSYKTVYIRNGNTVRRIISDHLRGGGPRMGYRGFVDLNWTAGVGDTSGVDCIGLTTSHGYQINPFIFIGLGVGFNYFYNGTAVNMPIFVNVRTDILQKRITPFVDLKVGYSIIDVEGFYTSPSIGCRFKPRRGLAFSIGVGYTLQKYDFEFHDNQDYWSGRLDLHGLNVRFGIEF